jgi:multimeric flavodoxin WrbA
MRKKILILSGSPKKNGNTSILVRWFCEGASSQNALIETIHAAFLKYKAPGCTSCRICQQTKSYACAINDDARDVLSKMIAADCIVMATPLYFFSASAQLKIIFDRMFSLYKWNNKTGTMKTPLKGKKFVLLASAFENTGLKALEKPFSLTADYTGMPFYSLLVANAGVSGEIKKIKGLKDKVATLGKKIAQ